MVAGDVAVQILEVTFGGGERCGLWTNDFDVCDFYLFLAIARSHSVSKQRPEHGPMKRLSAKKEEEESIEFVKLVISKCPSLLAEPNIRGETPLHLAARFGHNNIVEFLIRDIKNAQYEDLESSAEASTSDKMLKKTSPDGDTALHEAGSTAKHLKKAGYKRGRHSIRQAPPHNMSTINRELMSSLQKASESHQIVATLIATVTFAAGFTLPGGYNGQDGPDEGTAILTRKSAFKTFLVTDTLALALSISAVLINFNLAMQPPKRKFCFLFFWAYHFTVVALALMAVAFMTGVYAVLPHFSSGLGVAICVIGSYLALLCTGSSRLRL
ncbi:hypothetical protein GH714_030006 [Hevea brasiliensis]|uniref:PGG domain-containing protein n=1 Tax=Hevea brasiliensis TaxID=3981 RepID=A0A6A6N7Z4_HEVBR|nr:hypothetical protein GH714_030006 [Hevea brasiliensis]